MKKKSQRNIINNINEISCVGVFSPSLNLVPDCIERFVSGLNNISKLGDITIKYDSAIENERFLFPEIRAQQFNELVADKDVDLILTTIGGCDTICILEHIDIEKYCSAPKTIIGYSDTCILLLYLYSKTGALNYFGPCLLAQLADFPMIDEVTYSRCINAINRINPVYSLEPVGYELEAWRSWERENEWKIERKKIPENCIVTHKPGEATGRIIYVNLDSIAYLLTQDWFQLVEPVILFVESSNGAAYLNRLCRDLHLLKNYIENRHAKGFVFGRFPIRDHDELSLAMRMINRSFSYYQGIVVSGVAFGHVDPISTIPIGIEIYIHAEEDNVTFDFMEIN